MKPEFRAKDSLSPEARFERGGDGLDPPPLAKEPTFPDPDSESAATKPAATQSKQDTSRFDGPIRSSERAVDTVHRINAQLGLAAKAAHEKVEHMAKGGAQLLAALPTLFYEDIKGPFKELAKLYSGQPPEALLIGDAQLANLMTQQTPDGKVVWGFGGDPDKSDKGPLDWDVLRLATHAVLSARRAGGYSRADEEEFVSTLARGYFDELRKFAATGKKPNGYLRNKLDGNLARFLKKAADESQKKFISNRAPHGKLHDGKFAADGTQIFASKADVRAAVQDWATRVPNGNGVVKVPVEILDIALKAPSVGGSNSGLVKGRAVVAPAKKGDPPIVLELKQLLPSPVTNGTGHLDQADGEKVVEHAAALTGFKDPLLGFATVEKHDPGGQTRKQSVLVRPEYATSKVLEPESLKHKADYLNLVKFAGIALARAHLQSPGVTPDAVKKWLGDSSADAAAFERLRRFAVEYANQTDADAAAL